jgi:hypothetical protein
MLRQPPKSSEPRNPFADLTQLLDSNTGATFPFYESLTLPHLGSALTGVEREHGQWFHPSVSIESQ